MLAINMNKTDVLQGTLDLMVLKTLESMGSQHGYGIAQRLQQVSEDLLQLNQGTLYPALLRLEQRGWISSKWGTSENNRRARFYTLTRAGQKQLQREADDWHRMAAIMARLLGGAPPARTAMSVRELLARAGGALGLRPPRSRARAGAAASIARCSKSGIAPAGSIAAAARRAARLELGGDAQIAEAWRDQRSLPFARHAAAGRRATASACCAARPGSPPPRS